MQHNEAKWTLAAGPLNITRDHARAHTPTGADKNADTCRKEKYNVISSMFVIPFHWFTLLGGCQGQVQHPHDCSFTPILWEWNTCTGNWSSLCRWWHTVNLHFNLYDASTQYNKDLAICFTNQKVLPNTCKWFVDFLCAEMLHEGKKKKSPQRLK